MDFKKKNISLTEEIIEKGTKRAESFGLNFSSYVRQLVYKDIKSNERKESTLKERLDYLER